MKKKVLISVILFLISGSLILASLLILFIGYGDDIKLSAAGIISIFILPPPGIIIDSPKNITYNFTIDDFINNSMFIDLNVSASSFNPDLWWYVLDGLDAGISSGNIGFVPNSSINAFRRSNRLTVFGFDGSMGLERSASVDFFVFVPNSAPVIENLSSQIFACESSFLSNVFNAIDIDEDLLSASMTPQFPQNPFFIRFYGSINNTVDSFEIFSGILSKFNAGGINAGSNNYSVLVSVSDNYNASCCSDSVASNITVIEINNAPKISNILNQVVLTSGNGSNFYHEFLVNDTETGNQSTGNFTFIINFSLPNGTSINPLFSITNTGIINYIGSRDDVGTYNVTVCAIDQPLTNPHVNISDYCNQDGNSQRACQNFSLTISNVPVPPAPPSGGGGGGGSISCLANWGCEEWNQCTKFEKLFSIRVVRNETLRSELMENCKNLGYLDENCGYQQRNCIDLSECKIEKYKPPIIKECYYTEFPTCDDGIKNCHDGYCEVLADCGGPCEPCSTCRDGIRNQDEKGIDCGGPCEICKLEEPKRISFSVLSAMIAIISVLSLIVIVLLLRYIIHRKQYKKILEKRILKQNESY